MPERLECEVLQKARYINTYLYLPLLLTYVTSVLDRYTRTPTHTHDRPQYCKATSNQVHNGVKERTRQTPLTCVLNIKKQYTVKTHKKRKYYLPLRAYATLVLDTLFLNKYIIIFAAVTAV